MEYGPGAVDGSKVFLNNILPEQGDEMTKDISKFVRKHCRSGCHEVLVGDIEVSLCTITHYCKHIKELSTGKRAQELTVFPGYRPRNASGYEAEPELPQIPVDERAVSNLPSRWYTKVLKPKVLKKKPSGKGQSTSIATRRPTPSFMAHDAKSQKRGKRGSPGARPSTAKGRKKWDAKHPHFCTLCKQWFGARAKMHCNTPLQLNAGDIKRRE